MASIEAIGSSEAPGPSYAVLYMAALAAIRCITVIRALADRLKAGGQATQGGFRGLREKIVNDHERHVEKQDALGPHNRLTSNTVAPP